MNYNLAFKTKEEKIEFLEKMSSGRELDFEYMKKFNDEELKKYKDGYVEVSQKHLKLQGKLLEVSVPVKAEIKATVQQLDIILGIINDGGLIVTDNCYKVRDDENKTMCYFNSEGDFVYSRPYTAFDMQMDITTPTPPPAPEESEETGVSIVQ